MKKASSILFVLGCVNLFAGCDVNPSDQSAREESNLIGRSMIIGGVPVHERDYKLPEQHVIGKQQ